MRSLGRWLGRWEVKKKLNSNNINIDTLFMKERKEVTSKKGKEALRHRKRRIVIPGRRFVQYRLQLLPERVRLVPHIVLTASTIDSTSQCPFPKPAISSRPNI